MRDIERGVADGIRPEPWQTDTSIGDWYYRTGQKYMTAGEVVRMLADIVSKNGNLLLNVVQTPEGDLEPDVLAILDGIGAWIAVNGEGIYGTRPWKVYGEGPSTTDARKRAASADSRTCRPSPSPPEDFRFTASKDGKHPLCLLLRRAREGIPDRLARHGFQTHRKAIASVEILGGDGKGRMETGSGCPGGYETRGYSA